MKTHWIAGLHLYTQRVCAEPPCTEEDVVMFWLRLYGVLAEFPAELAGEAKAFETLTEVEVERLNGTARLALLRYRGCKRGMEGIVAAVSRDLLIYAELRRNSECHLNQKAFLLQVNGKIGTVETIKHESRLKCLGGGLSSVSELQDAAKRVMIAHSLDDRAVAQTIARLIESHVAEMLAARRLLD
ncbi:MAG: hypothetical protein RLZZ450_7625 [Pseudomonadota bacterium]